jgi:hypothetical protein
MSEEKQVVNPNCGKHVYHAENKRCFSKSPPTAGRQAEVLSDDDCRPSKHTQQNRGAECPGLPTTYDLYFTRLNATVVNECIRNGQGKGDWGETKQHQDYAATCRDHPVQRPLTEDGPSIGKSRAIMFCWPTHKRAAQKMFRAPNAKNPSVDRARTTLDRSTYLNRSHTALHDGFSGPRAVSNWVDCWHN